MENVINYTTDYKARVNEIIRNNFKSVLIGAFVLSVSSSLLYFKIAGTPHIDENTLGLFNSVNMEQSNTVKNLSQKIKRQKLPLTAKPSQPSDSLGVASDTQGQISAIGTQQVTLKGEKYTVQPGDSISSIALQAYGDLNAWPRIAQANQLANPEAIEVGMVLIIPR